MVSKVKIGIILVGGGITLVVGYVVYGKLTSGGAQQSQNNLLGSIGAKGLSFLGMQQSQPNVTLSKDDSMASNQKLTNMSTPYPVVSSPVKQPGLTGKSSLAQMVNSGVGQRTPLKATTPSVLAKKSTVDIPKLVSAIGTGNTRRSVSPAKLTKIANRSFY